MRRGNGTGGCLAAFGAGLLLATLFPSKCILILAAVTLVLAGCSRAMR